MTTTFLTTLTENELKSFLKEIIQEVLIETPFLNTNNLPNILDIDQAAEFLKIKNTTIYRRVSQRTIPHFKKGKRLYFSRLELENWIQDGRVFTEKEAKTLSHTFFKKRK